MNDGHNGGPSPELTLPFWYAFSNNMSNLAAEFYSLQSEVSMAARRSDACPISSSAIDNCRKSLARFAKAARNPFSSTLAKYLFLQKVSQDIILADHEDVLPTRWNTIQKRILAASENERGLIQSLDAYKVTLKYFSDSSSGAPVTVRHALKALKSYTDEKVTLSIWHSSVTRSRSNVLLAIAIIVAGAICAHFTLTGSDERPTVIWLICLGLLGGTLSSIMRPSPVEIPLSAASTLLRPILGSIAALLLFIVVNANIVRIDQPFILYLASLGIGFSDKALTDLLTSTSERFSRDITQAIGHPTSSDISSRVPRS
jgi:hypothetical protein